MTKNPNFSYEIKEVLGEVATSVSSSGRYAKAVLKTLMKQNNSDPGETGIDIRKYDRTLMVPSGSGIRLTVQEANNVCDILLKNGFGSTDVLEEEYNKRRNLYTEVQNEQSVG